MGRRARPVGDAVGGAPASRFADVPATEVTSGTSGTVPSEELTEATEATCGTSAEDADDALDAGAVVGRFVITGEVGKGGMGRVFRAYDPDLDRKVAIKLLRKRYRDDHWRARALREAQAMAKLSHPNVVTVYEVGTFEEQIFFAMELVEGVTLRRWLAQSPRSWRQVVDVMAQAGRGLVAAHRAELVHRDIKPSNILIDVEGRARVTDFGIASSSRRDAASVPDGARAWEVPTAPELTASQITNPSALATPLTQAGSIVGTPAYMAPEQRDGHADARSDQYSFCLTMYEALFGERPPGGLDRRGVPKWLRGLVLRGLSEKAEQRYPSMEALLAELSRDRQARRRRIASAGGGLALAGLAAFGFLRTPDSASAAGLCRGVEQRLAGSWDQETRGAVRAAFVGTGNRHAEDTWVRVERGLDEYAGAWVAMRTHACEATHVRGEQSAALLDLRMQCLDRRLEELHALTALFARKADVATVDRAVVAVGSLSSLDGCANAAALAEAVPMPVDPAARQTIAELFDRLAEAKALGLAGRFAEGVVIAQAAVREAEPFEYAPLRAEALYRLAGLQSGAGDGAAGEASLRRALAEAAAAHDDELFASCLIALLRVVSYDQSRPTEAMRLRSIIEAAVVRAGGNRQLLAEAMHNVGIALAENGFYREAIENYQAALKIREEVLGEDHYQVGASLNNLANAVSDAGDFRESIPIYDRALALNQKTLGPAHPGVARMYNNRGLAYEALGDYEHARADLEAALELWEPALGPDHPEVGRTLNNLGMVLIKAGDLDRAGPALARSLEIKRRAYGTEHYSYAATRMNQARLALARRDFAGALPMCEETLATASKLLRPDHPSIAHHLDCLGEARTGLGDQRGAVEVLERSLEVRIKAKYSDADLAHTRFLLASALDHGERALSLANQALRELQAIGYPERDIEAVRAWLASREQGRRD